MTIEEYRTALEDLSPENLKLFTEDFGVTEKTIEQIVRDFVDNPTHERRICQLLALRTEDEKMTVAALRSATASEQSASTAKYSMILSIVSAAVAVISVIITIITVIQKGK